MGVRRTPPGRAFLEWNLESPDRPVLLAWSEQGLYFWRFLYLIEYEVWEDDAVAVGRLTEAAEAVGFRNLDRLWAFLLQHGQEADYQDRVRAEALTIEDFGSEPRTEVTSTSAYSGRYLGSR